MSEELISHYSSWDVEGKNVYLCSDRKTFDKEKTTERLHEVTCPKCKKILVGKEILEEEKNV